MMKKYFIFISFFLFSASSIHAQQREFVLEGKISNSIVPKQVYIQYTTGGKAIIDSTKIINKQFNFKGLVGDPVPARLYFDYSNKGITDPKNKVDAKIVYLEALKMQIVMKDSLKNSSVMGSQLNDDFNKYLGMSDSLQAVEMDLRRAAAKDANIRANFRTHMKALQSNNVAAFKKFVQNNPSSYFSLDAIQYLINNKVNVSDVEKMLESLDLALQNSREGQQTKRTLAFEKLTGIGQNAIDFIQNDTSDRAVDTKQFRGKYLLIDFWASWCGPCRGENPYLIEAYTKYKDYGFEILGVSLDDSKNRASWIKAIEDDKLPWTQVSDLKGWKNEAAQQYGIRSIPANFLINPEGIIIERNLRGMQLETILKDLFLKKGE